MRSALAVVLAVLVYSASLAQFPAPRGDEAAKHGWLASLAEAKAQARKTGKPLMVVLRCVP